MAKKRFTAEQIIHFLREAEVLLAHGRTLAELTLDKQILKETAEGNF